MTKLSDIDAELEQLLSQYNRERCSPKVEQLRGPHIGGDCSDSVIIRGIRGGRGAGAKSYGVISLNVQEAHYYKHKYGCFREVQRTLAESVYSLIEETVERLHYHGWKFREDYIESPTGSHFIFRGLKDLTATDNVKGLQGFTRFIIEEAASISAASIDKLLPTLFRNKGSILWFVYNQYLETDPITTKVWQPFKNEAYAKLIECRPGALDNPWWFEGDLELLSNKMKAIDPDLWDHIYGGNPLSQLYNAAISRLFVRQAMDRVLSNPEGAIEIGCDPADEGDDKTQIYKRKGMKVVDHKELRKMDGEYIANEIWHMTGHRPDVPIKLDTTGIGTSTRDNLRRLGAKVIPIHFANKAENTDEYPDVVSEMWFHFNNVLREQIPDLPDDPELMSDLSSRLYKYDKAGRRCIESKKDFKVRHLRSPDKGDALLLCFYTAKNIISEERRKQLAQRYRR